ncbi:hypothetical protein CI41S_03370 [Bradyrhizobium ivorense]|nr:hypothetical protein CI41S_03370 [Bradyrhizobium ivorense]
MIRKTVKRFSEKIMLKQKSLILTRFLHANRYPLRLKTL